MEQTLIAFENEAFGEVRTILLDDEPWFVATDVCKALEIGNVSMALSRLDADEKGISSIDTLGGTQKVSIINEPGLYSLILTSRKPEAKAFKRWITHEVIPAIRRHGAYITAPLLEQVANDPSLLFRLAEGLLRERERADTLEHELECAAPKAAYYDAFVSTAHCTSIRATAKELNYPERKFVQFLIAEGYVYRTVAGPVLPYNKPSNKGLFIVRDFYRNGHSGCYTLITPYGKNLLRQRLPLADDII